MPDVVVEPGTRLVQRYRLEEDLGGRPTDDAADTTTTTGGTRVPGAAYWRAHDELLDRPVGIWLLGAASAHAEAVLAAARRAAALADSRFLRILDAAEVDGMVYVVSEWVPARSLLDLLAEGPLPPAEARALATDIAGALEAAHASGLTHLALTPAHVLRTAHGQVKLAGLEVDAAAHGVAARDARDAEARDTAGAASVLYAALTARWPGTEPAGLPPAPRDGGALCSPRQVRAGVPDDLDDLVCRALGVPGRQHSPAVRTVAELSAALAAAPATSRLPLPVPGRLGGSTESHDGVALGLHDDEQGYDAPGAPAGRPRVTAVAWAVVVVVLLLGVGLAGGQLVSDLGGEDRATGSDRPGAQVQAASDGVQEVAVRRAMGFDPQGQRDGDGAENDDHAREAVDGDPGTGWYTKDYFDPFGPAGIKDGVGLLLVLDEPSSLSEVRVLVRGGPTDLEVRIAEERGQDLDDYRLLDRAGNVDGRATLRADRPVTARYVLIWLTGLPEVDGGYRGEVAEVVLRG